MSKALVIVAHPDDETIWMGGTILRNKSWNWVIFSLSRKDDPDRAPKFIKTCSRYGAQPIIADLEDNELKPVSTEEIVSKIKENLKIFDYDYIYTHGENGEYGHLRHQEIHQAVRFMVVSGGLKCRKLFYYSYEPGGKSVPGILELKIPLPKKNSDSYTLLNNEEFKAKIQLIAEYGFKPNSFERLSCSRKEAFNLH